MIYLATLLQFGSFITVLLVLSACARLSGMRAGSWRMAISAAGSVAGYILAPCIAVATGQIQSIFIEPRYFTEVFMGCIAPVTFAMGYLTVILGALLGFTLGCTFASQVAALKAPGGASRRQAN
ncbi:MAG: hypothetical protein EOP83_18955 [Verrucomicrobiaceae bacterium]|nr:MAG: hypothetical protein EOP83_18955 [Verrucomicrobiaceae bacterium]